MQRLKSIFFTLTLLSFAMYTLSANLNENLMMKLRKRSISSTKENNGKNRTKNQKKVKTNKHHQHSSNKKKYKQKLTPLPSNQGQISPFQTPDCGSVPDQPEFECKFVCPYDVQCQVLGWNRTKIPCACGAIICHDMQLYGFPSYTSGKPLNDSQIAFEPHVVASCNCTVSAEVAPFHQAIQNETCDVQNYPLPQTNPPTGQGNYYTLSEILDKGSKSSEIQ